MKGNSKKFFIIDTFATRQWGRASWRDFSKSLDLYQHFWIFGTFIAICSDFLIGVADA
jgi:hypothetical protein